MQKTRLESISQELDQLIEQPVEAGFIEAARLHSELRRLSHRDQPEIYIEALLRVVQMFYSAGRPMLGTEPATQAVAIARGIDRKLLRRALVHQAIILSEECRLDAALVAGTEALEISIDLQEDDLIASSLNGVGVAIMYTGGYAFTLKCLDLAKAALPWLTGTVASNKALCHLRTRNPGAAEANLAVAIAQEKSPETRVNTRALHAELLTSQGRLVEAEAALQMGLQEAEKIRSDRARMTILTSKALVFCCTGRAQDGLAMLEDVLLRSRLVKSNLLDALDVAEQAYKALGLTTRADAARREAEMTREAFEAQFRLKEHIETIDAVLARLH